VADGLHLNALVEKNNEQFGQTILENDVCPEVAPTFGVNSLNFGLKQFAKLFLNLVYAGGLDFEVRVLFRNKEVLAAKCIFDLTKILFEDTCDGGGKGASEAFTCN